MSPEQAELNATDIDTRADVYGLGVLLYELLTGGTPFDKEELASAALNEAFRIVREKDPPKPSTRISSLGDRLTTISHSRGTNPLGLSRLVRGDLEWIVMTALEKDWTRRYDTAISLALDVGRFIANEPIEARAPTTLYRFRKFASRHRTQVLVGMVLIVAALVGGTATAFGWVKYSRLYAEKQQEVDRNRKLLEDYHEDLIERALYSVLAGDGAQTNSIARKLKELECSSAQLDTIEGIRLFYAGELVEARSLLQKASDADSMNLSAASMLCVLQLYDGGKEGPSSLSRVIEMQPREDFVLFDTFFQAFALMYHDPVKSQNLLGKLLKGRPSPIVRAHFAAAVAEECSHCKDKYDAQSMIPKMETALQDIRIARSSSPDSRWLDMLDFFVCVIAMEIRKCAGQEDWKDLKELTDQLAMDIASREAAPIGILVAACYYELTDQLESAGESHDKLANLGSSRSRLACLWYPHNPAKALSLLTTPRVAKSAHSWQAEVGLEEDITRCLLVAFEKGSLPDGVDWDELTARFKNTAYAMDLLQVGLALKFEKEVTELAKAIRSAGTFRSLEVGSRKRFCLLSNEIRPFGR